MSYKTNLKTTNKIQSAVVQKLALTMKISALGADTISKGRVFQSLITLCEKLCPLIVVLNRLL